MGNIVLNKTGSLFLKLLFPPVCPLCDRLLPDLRDAGLCGKCAPKVKPIEGNICFKCGKLMNDDAEYCANCAERNRAFVRNFMLYLYEDEVKEMMIKLKYKSRRDIGCFFGTEAVKRFGEDFKRLKPDAVIPVPVHKTRLRERGYNQAAVIAEKIGELTGIPAYPDIAVRNKQTTAQKKLGSLERLGNLRNAFSVDEWELDRAERKGRIKRVLLVDDIMTTGSTMECVAEMLKKAGIKEVYGFTVCGTRA